MHGRKSTLPQEMEILTALCLDFRFPLGSPDVGERRIADQALDSFGISIPLIEFREVTSNCSRQQEEKIIVSDGGEANTVVLKSSTTKHPLVVTRSVRLILPNSSSHVLTLSTQNTTSGHRRDAPIKCRGISKEAFGP